VGAFAAVVRGDLPVRYLALALDEQQVLGTPALPAHLASLAECYYDRHEASNGMQLRPRARASSYAKGFVSPQVSGGALWWHSGDTLVTL
jgi:hypothetical protein